MNDIIEVTVTEIQENELDWGSKNSYWVKLETDSRVIHSHESRSPWFSVKNFQMGTSFDRELKIGDKVLLKFIYAGYYSPLTRTDIFGNPFGNCKIAKADAIASVFEIKENDPRLAKKF